MTLAERCRTLGSVHAEISRAREPSANGALLFFDAMTASLIPKQKKSGAAGPLVAPGRLLLRPGPARALLEHALPRGPRALGQGAGLAAARRGRPRAPLFADFRFFS